MVTTIFVDEPENRRWSQLFAAGAVATTMMVISAAIIRFLGISAPDFGMQYGAVLHHHIYPDRWSADWWLGMAWHLIDGVFILPLIFDYVREKGIIPVVGLGQGLLFGVVVWVLVAVTVSPLAGEGAWFADLSHPVFYGTSLLLSWLVYGAVLENAAEQQRIRLIRIEEEWAA